jgi:hypothetical protein
VYQITPFIFPGLKCAAGVIRDQWLVVSGQWLVVSGQRSVGSDQNPADLAILSLLCAECGINRQTWEREYSVWIEQDERRSIVKGA